MSTDHYDCPLCDWQIEIPAGDDPVIAGGVAAAMGVPADAFALIREHQRKQRLEHDLDQHLRTHGPTEWVPALLEARRSTVVMGNLLHDAVAATQTMMQTSQP